MSIESDGKLTRDATCAKWMYAYLVSRYIEERGTGLKDILQCKRNESRHKDGRGEKIPGHGKLMEEVLCILSTC